MQTKYCISPKISLIIVVLFFFFISCEDKYYEEISKITNNEAIIGEIVINGGVTSEKKYQNITLIKPITLDGQNIDSISGAIVKLKIGDIYYDFIEELYHPNINSLNKRKGTYVSVDSIQGVPGVIHTLIVDYAGKTYTASDIMTKISPFDFNSIDLPYKSGGGQYDSLGVLINPLVKQKIFHFGAMESSIYHWFALDTINGHDKSESFLYYFKIVNQQGLLSEMYQTLANSWGLRISFKITVTRFSMSQQYVDYLIAVLKETYWNNNLFSTMSANV
ncbi:MAG: DUF4249 family protein, partial [Bacteroidales bacterium]|nr:DUF4249 family protein [Bacteroidales bacterium]